MKQFLYIYLSKEQLLHTLHICLLIKPFCLNEFVNEAIASHMSTN